MLPAVAGVDKVFDYTVPDDLAGGVRVGTVVRVDLAGRTVAGWVVADGVVPEAGLALRPLRRVTGWGPEADVVDLAGWAAWRWAGRRSALLATASAERSVASLPPADLRPPARPAGDDPAALDDLVAEATAGGTRILQLPPAADPTAAIALVAQSGPTLVVVPSTTRAEALAERLRRAGAGVALVPGEWHAARAGRAVVVGSRAAAWAPVPGLAAVVVVDAHDEGLAQEQAPTWWASTVAAERARRAGVPCVWITPVPTLDLLAASDAVVRPAVGAERRGWAPLEVVDRRADDPRLGLYSERLVAALRSADRAVCVLNRTGRARLLACGRCGEVARCERCGGATVLDGRPGGTFTDASVATRSGSDGDLVCVRCGLRRPQVCAVCDSTRLRQLRPGVAKVREELEVLVGRPVGEVTAASTTLPATAVTVGTEAVLHRAGAVDLVAFLDMDQELLAPRFRAGEEALALLARAARLVGGRRRDGRVLVQTRAPDHEALAAAAGADPALLGAPDAELRHELRLPPTTSLALLSGPGADGFARHLGGAGHQVEVLGQADGSWLVRASDSATLADALAATPRPAERVRVSVDPVRL